MCIITTVFINKQEIIALKFNNFFQQTCQTFTRSRTKYRMKYGPVLKEIVVKGSFRNSDLFAKVWNCPKKSFMNPVKKCPLLMGEKTEHEWREDEDDFMIDVGVGSRAQHSPPK